MGSGANVLRTTIYHNTSKMFISSPSVEIACDDFFLSFLLVTSRSAGSRGSTPELLMLKGGKRSGKSEDNGQPCKREKQREECGGWIIDKAEEEGKKGV